MSGERHGKAVGKGGGREGMNLFPPFFLESLKKTLMLPSFLIVFWLFSFLICSIDVAVSRSEVAPCLFSVCISLVLLFLSNPLQKFKLLFLSLCLSLFAEVDLVVSVGFVPCDHLTVARVSDH